MAVAVGISGLIAFLATGQMLSEFLTPEESLIGASGVLAVFMVLYVWTQYTIETLKAERK